MIGKNSRSAVISWNQNLKEKVIKNEENEDKKLNFLLEKLTVFNFSRQRPEPFAISNMKTIFKNLACL